MIDDHNGSIEQMIGRSVKNADLTAVYSYWDEKSIKTRDYSGNEVISWGLIIYKFDLKEMFQGIRMEHSRNAQ